MEKRKFELTDIEIFAVHDALSFIRETAFKHGKPGKAYDENIKLIERLIKKFNYRGEEK